MGDLVDRILRMIREHNQREQRMLQFRKDLSTKHIKPRIRYRLRMYRRLGKDGVGEWVYK